MPRRGQPAGVARYLSLNDEEEALCSEDFALGHQGNMPAIQEYLQEMVELESRPPTARGYRSAGNLRGY